MSTGKQFTGACLLISHSELILLLLCGHCSYQAWSTGEEYTLLSTQPTASPTARAGCAEASRLPTRISPSSWRSSPWETAKTLVHSVLAIAVTPLRQRWG
jgi:hypothetical protein